MSTSLFDPDDWKRRYVEASRLRYEDVERMDHSRRDALIEMVKGGATLAEPERVELDRLNDQYRAALAPVEAMLQEWAAAYPDREYRPARDPNRPPSFPPELTEALKFVRCRGKVPCALCGKPRKRHWTMVIPFRAAEMGQFALRMSEQVFYPLTPVCDDHPLKPDVLPEERPT